jgi:hypothetical protein
MSTPAPFIVGWQEWVALPGLGLPAIKAKIDTGARTSALDAFLIEPFGPASQPMVRFGIHPIPGRLDVEIFCSAPIVDRRDVTSSNGERETRYFIRAEVEMGGRIWPIEIGLTNRESMSYRMLLGRQAIREDMMVDPAGSFRQPLLSYRLYRGIARRKPARTIQRPLRIALVSREPDNAFNRRLIEAAGARGHVLELLDLMRLRPTFGPEGPGIVLDETALAHHDAVVPRVGTGDGPYGAAIVRQLEAMGSVALNPGDAIERVANRLASVQALARAEIAQGLRWSPDGEVGPPPASFLRALVIGDTAAAVVRCRGERRTDAGLARHRTARRLAERAAQALGLALATIDIDDMGERPLVIGLSAKPALARIERTTESELGGTIIEAIETRVRATGVMAAGSD